MIYSLQHCDRFSTADRLQGTEPNAAVSQQAGQPEREFNRDLATVKRPGHGKLDRAAVREVPF